jgi:MFS family permease
MASPYRQVLAVPGTPAFEVAALAARMAHLMTVLSIFFFIPAATGSYGLAGELSGAYALAYSLGSPFVSRLADRDWPGRVLAGAAVANALARTGLLACVWAGAPVWGAIGLAAFSGASMPAAGPLARARWSRLLHGSPLLHAALSFESVVDETILVIAPILVATLATAVAPAAGLIMALVMATAGNTTLAALAARSPGRPVTGRSRRPTRRTPWSAPGFTALILAFILVGAAQTLIDLNTVAFAARHHAKPLSGLVLTAIALASAVSGLWYGSRSRHITPHRRLPAALSLLACGTLPFAVAPDVWFLFPAAVLLGFTVAPAIITGFSIVGLAVPPAQVTEGLTWVTSAMGTGIAIGSAAAGQFADGWGGRLGFACAACCAAAAALAGYAVRHRTSSPAPASAP